jgi:hypothetical protein
VGHFGPRQRPAHRGHRSQGPANRYEIGYHAKLADEPTIDLTPQELRDNGIDLVI